MKKALKIGAVVLGMHYAFNLGYVIGLADPIVDALVARRYDLANYNSRRIAKAFDAFPPYGSMINDIAKWETNLILKIKKENRRVKVKYVKKN